MPELKIACTGKDIFVFLDGVKIAKRGRPNTPEAGTWVSLKQGYTVTSSSDHSEIYVDHDGVRVH
jgi:hypothetical protein